MQTSAGSPSSRPRRILVVEDAPALLRTLRLSLQAHGYAVDTAATGDAALSTAAQRPPDIVLLDLILPDLAGLEVLAHLRKRSEVRVIVVTALTSVTDRMKALAAGADDYVTKPFAMAHLIDRIRALEARPAESVDGCEPPVRAGEYVVDCRARQATSVRTGEQVRLTPTEWRLLGALIARCGRPVSQAQLLAEVWGPDHSLANHYLRVYIGKLRQKLEADPRRPRHLVTEPGAGYSFRP